MAETSSIENRTIGSLLGVAVGDALGQPIECVPSKNEINLLVDRFGKRSNWIQKSEQFYKELEQKHGGKVTEMLENPFGSWKLGETTDDTAQTLLLVDSLVESGGYNPDDFVRKLIGWHDNGKAKGMGKTTRISLSEIISGASWKNSGKIALQKGGVPSNGSLMRTIPVGLFFRKSPEKIDNKARELSMMTHAAEQAVLACQMASQLVAQLTNGTQKEDALRSIRERYGQIYTLALDNLTDYQKYPGGALASFAVAVTSFAESSSFEEAVIKAVNIGGDADTYGSITGAFAGACWGLSSIPERWSTHLNPINSEQIIDKARKLYILSERT